MGDITIVGTSHVSEKSIAEVKETIERVHPDVVAIELCKNRYEALRGNVKEVAVRDVLGSGKMYLFLVQSLLAFMQRRIGATVDVEPGAEMVSAIDKAEELGIDIALVDRDIQITLQRFWTEMGLFEKMKLFGSIIWSFFGKGEEIDLDTITEEDVVESLMLQLRKSAPTASRVLVDERDAYLASNLLNLAKDKNVVAVVGAGHKEGILSNLRNPELIPPLSELRRVRKRRISLARVAGVGIVGFVFLLFALIILSGVSINTIMTAFAFWIVINGTLAAIGTALARGHPFSIVTAFGVAWLTSLNPAIAAGWFAGLVEARMRPPRVEDLKTLMDVETVTELMKNRFFRVILVAALANIGSIIGTFIGAYVVYQTTGIELSTLLSDAFSRIGGIFG
ncbi:MAG: TraB/GumN family protein [Halobacteriota archaeon]|nr:TraB/GumN family protein [Halobacteriota archaeon]